MAVPRLGPSWMARYTRSSRGSGIPELCDPGSRRFDGGGDRVVDLYRASERAEKVVVRWDPSVSNEARRSVRCFVPLDVDCIEKLDWIEMIEVKVCVRF